MLDLNKCYLGDCLDIMRDMPDKCVDLVLTDPPYGININNNMGRRKGDKPSQYRKCEWDIDSPDKLYFEEMFRISKNQIIFGANNFISKINKDSQCWLVWDKGFSQDLSFAQVELAWTSFTSTSKIFKITSADVNRLHPTQKPLKLMEWCLKRYSSASDIIFDGFAGSFSVAHACINTGRKFICVEKDEEYYKIGVERVKKAQAQGKLAEWF